MSKMSVVDVRKQSKDQPQRVLIYGSGGVGKTTFASEFPDAIFLDTQGGTAMLDVASFPKPDTFTDVQSAIKSLRDDKHEYKTLVVDLLDDVESMIWSHMCSRDKESSIESYGYGKGYKVALSEWRALLASLDALRGSRGMEIVLVAHSAIRTFKNPEGDDYDRYGLQLHEQASSLIRGWCDTVLFARHETVLKADPAKKRTRGISTGARVIHTVETAAYFAKNRCALPDTMPLDYATYSDACAMRQPASPGALLSEIRELSMSLEGELFARVMASVDENKNDSVRLSKILNKLREMKGKDQ